MSGGTRTDVLTLHLASVKPRLGLLHGDAPGSYFFVQTGRRPESGKNRAFKTVRARQQGHLSLLAGASGSDGYAVRPIRANNCRGTATSANWKRTYLAWATTLASQEMGHASCNDPAPSPKPWGSNPRLAGFWRPYHERAIFR